MSRTILGLDEAGRGCVIGDLVVGGFLINEDKLGELQQTGVTDSKNSQPIKENVSYTNY